jgi:uncharacterized protein YcaQ
VIAEATLGAARRLAIRNQHLGGAPLPRGKRGVLRAINDLGYVQLDPTNVVARSHLLVLRARIPDFDARDLEALLASKRLFEYAAFVLPTDDFAFHAVRMAANRRRMRVAGSPHARWLAANAALRRHVLSRLRREEAVATSAFEDRSVSSWESTGWTRGKNVSQMLEFLWRQGLVTVRDRANGERRWTLASRWLPRTRALPLLAAERFATERAVRALGIGTFPQLRATYAFGRFVSRRALDWLEREGRVRRVAVEGAAAREAWYVHDDDAGELAAREAATRAILLSPFDNLIIDRARTERLFGFRYRMEIYVPPAQRRFGYFAMPILFHDRIVGTVDPRLDRAARRLHVLSVRSAPDARDVPVAVVREAVEALAAFVGARDVAWPRSLPAAWTSQRRRYS